MSNCPLIAPNINKVYSQSGRYIVCKGTKKDRKYQDFRPINLEIHVAAITLGPHREVHPDGCAALLQNQLIKVQLLPVRDVQQDAGIAYRLFLPSAVDIYCAPRQQSTSGPEQMRITSDTL